LTIARAPARLGVLTLSTVSTLLALSTLSGVSAPFAPLLAPLAAQDGAGAGVTAPAPPADRLRGLQLEADRLASESRALLDDVRQLEIERRIRSDEVASLTIRAQLVADELRDVTAQIDRLERETLRERPQLEARLVELYKLGRGRDWRLLLSVSDLSELGRASRMAALLAARDRDRIAAHDQRRAALSAARQRLEADSHALVTLRADAARAQSTADRQVALRNRAIRKIDAERDLNAQLTGSTQGGRQPLDALRGMLDWPLAGRVSRHAADASDSSPGSQGVSIAAAHGTPVQAIAEGTVAFAGPFVGFGNLVILAHGGQAFSLYGSLGEIRVATGAAVRTGDPVGTAGSSPAGPPDETGLYFEMRIDGQAVDPLQWLKKP
jgi:septal ring factor EnvC (AmiA/AmiB activator)